MKGPCTLVASIVAASTLAISSTTSYAAHPTPSTQGLGYSKLRSEELTLKDKDKFAPRFDGLRFIETLVTAHR